MGTEEQLSNPERGPKGDLRELLEELEGAIVPVRTAERVLCAYDLVEAA